MTPWPNERGWTCDGSGLVVLRPISPPVGNLIIEPCGGCEACWQDEEAETGEAGA